MTPDASQPEFGSSPDAGRSGPGGESVGGQDAAGDVSTDRDGRRLGDADGAGQAGAETMAGWLDAFRAGEREAGQRLLIQFEPWLRLLARHQMESRFQAKFDPSDVVQQTLLEAVRGASQFRGRTAAEFAAWLRQILSHVLAHEIRRYAGTAKRDVGREVPLEQDLTRTDARLGDILAASGVTPSRDAVRRDDAALLARVLEELSADDREILMLRHVEGLSHDDIARRLGRTGGAVRMAWVRALARLREAMKRVG